MCFPWSGCMWPKKLQDNLNATCEPTQAKKAYPLNWTQINLLFYFSSAPLFPRVVLASKQSEHGTLVRKSIWNWTKMGFWPFCWQSLSCKLSNLHHFHPSSYNFWITNCRLVSWTALNMNQDSYNCILLESFLLLFSSTCFCYIYLPLQRIKEESTTLLLKLVVIYLSSRVTVQLD